MVAGVMMYFMKMESPFNLSLSFLHNECEGNGNLPADWLHECTAGLLTL